MFSDPRLLPIDKRSYKMFGLCLKSILKISSVIWTSRYPHLINNLRYIQVLSMPLSIVTMILQTEFSTDFVFNSKQRNDKGIFWPSPLGSRSVSYTQSEMINTKILTPIPIVLETIFKIAVPIPIVLEMNFPIVVPIPIFNQSYFSNTNT